MAKQTAALTAHLHITTGPSPEHIRFGGRLLTANSIVVSSKTRLIIGRNPQIANLQIYDLMDDTSISRIHCSIYYDAGLNRFMLTDEASANGTFLNEQRMNPHEATQLHHGDSIELGRIWKNGIRFVFALEKIDSYEAHKRLIVRTEQKVKGTDSVPYVPNLGEILQEKQAAIDAGLPISAELARRIEGLDQAFPNTVSAPKRADDTSFIDELGASLKSAAELARKKVLNTIPIPSTNFEKLDVFISYSHENMNAMEAISKFLAQRHGLNVWTDKRINTGDLWQEEIGKNIADSYCFLILMSPTAKLSQWVQIELNYASTHKLPIFPVLLDGTEQNAIPLILVGKQYVKLNGDKREAARAIERLALDIKAKIAELRDEDTRPSPDSSVKF